MGLTWSVKPNSLVFKMKICYLSIDFEDYTHDYQRMLGVSKPRQTPDALWKAYERIDQFSQQCLDGAKLTFFTTGQVARDYPEIVRQIADDGHEVGCHYNEHDDVFTHNRETFRANLEIAIDKLSAASGQTIKGFRAPNFSIGGSCADWAYEELAKLFVYDSSYVRSEIAATRHEPQLLRFEDATLHEFAIYRRQLFPGFAVRVMGGTYLRLLPTSLVMKLLNEAWDQGYLGQVYLHPYEFLWDHEQWSRFSDLKELTTRKRYYWWARQHQWHTVGNAGVMDKLARIFNDFEHPGPMGARFGLGAQPAPQEVTLNS